ncbi:MAG: response regulator [Planctomycetota bacterium]
MSRILVAEDDPHILRLISLWLRRQGHDITEARNGLAAREAIEAAAVDVLVSDVNMPGLDGLALIEAVLPQGLVRRGVVVLTNRWDHAEIRERLARWGVRVLPKPFSPSQLSELIEELASTGQAGSVGDGCPPAGAGGSVGTAPQASECP